MAVTSHTAELFDLTGRVALVTGATRGLGAVFARSLAAAGAHVIVNGRDQAAIDARCDALFGWSARLLEAIDVARVYDASGSERRRLEHALRDTLDACREVGLDIEARLPAAVVRWWRAVAS